MQHPADCLAVTMRRWWREPCDAYGRSPHRALASIALVAAGFRPAACAFNHSDWDLLPDGWAAIAAAAGLTVGSEDEIVIVARDTAAFNAVADAIKACSTRAAAQRGGGMASPPVRLGRALGYPPLAVRAYAMGETTIDLGVNMPPEDIDPWARILLPFVPSGTRKGLLEAMDWVARARASIDAYLPGLPLPLDTE
jgi:hypothetical protein